MKKQPYPEDPHAPHGQPPVCIYSPERDGDDDDGVENPKRRKMLGFLVTAINAGVAGAVILPAAAFVAAPLLQEKPPKSRWVPLVDFSDLKDGETRPVTYQLDVPDGYTMSERKYTVLVSRRGNEVIAFDPTCPHMGCHVEFKDSKQQFICPCHGGVFDKDGNVVSGPPPEGLARIATRIEAGKVDIHKG
ncbi:MAG: ubiquinol-cytochrome c reductase iron-sulfur subunit [Abditibacteriaceae bacterium]